MSTADLEMLFGLQRRVVEYEPQTPEETEAVTAAFHELRALLGERLSVSLHGHHDRVAVRIEFTQIGGDSLRNLLDVADGHGCKVSLATDVRTNDGLTMGGYGAVLVAPEARPVKTDPPDGGPILH